MDVNEVPQLVFTNLQLLGFDPTAIEREYRIPCNREMFNLPNKKGFDAVMIFLFNRLDSTKSKEAFRDCWPVKDKKQEQQFRKVCNSWLGEISKEEDSGLPRINPSLLMSPGGDRFYQLLFALTGYVLLKCVTNENGVKTRDILRRPVLCPQSQPLAPVMARVQTCAAVRQRELFMEGLQQTSALQAHWTDYMQELVRNFRTVSKSVRDLEKRVQLEKQDRDRESLKSSRHENAGVAGYDQELENVHRAQQVQKVRELWQRVGELTDRSSAAREVVESVLASGAAQAVRIDGAQLNVRVPDQLLRCCEREIQRRRIENIYEGGKLNILSLIHLWNLSLHLYIEKLQQTGIPNFEGDIGLVKTQEETHNLHLANTRALRERLEKEFIPQLKQSIAELTRNVDRNNHSYSSQTTELAALMSSLNKDLGKNLGFGLMPPTPPVNFEPDGAKTPGYVGMATQSNKQTQPLTTPEAAEVLMGSIRKKVHHKDGGDDRHPGTQVHDTPKFATRHQPARKVFHEAKERRSTTKKVVKSKSATDHLSAETKISKISKGIAPARHTASNDKLKSIPTSKGPQKKQRPVKNNLPQPRIERHTVVSEKPSSRTSEAQKVGPSGDQRRGKGYFGALDNSGLSSIPRSPRDAHDILARELVDELLSDSSPRDTGSREHVETSTPGGLLGQDAFHPRDRLARSPPSAPAPSHPPAWQLRGEDAPAPPQPVELSYGPLSSARDDRERAPLEARDTVGGCEVYHVSGTALGGQPESHPDENRDDEENIVTISAHEEDLQVPVEDAKTENQPHGPPYLKQSSRDQQTWRPRSAWPDDEKRNGESSFLSVPPSTLRQETYGAESEPETRAYTTSQPDVTENKQEVSSNDVDVSNTTSLSEQQQQQQQQQRIRLSMDAFELRYQLKERNSESMSRPVRRLETILNSPHIVNKQIQPTRQADQGFDLSPVTETLAELAATATPILKKRTEPRYSEQTRDRRVENAQEEGRDTSFLGVSQSQVANTRANVKDKDEFRLSPLDNNGFGDTSVNLLEGSFSLPPSSPFLLDMSPTAEFRSSQTVNPFDSPNHQHPISSPFRELANMTSSALDNSSSVRQHAPHRVNSFQSPPVVSSQQSNVHSVPFQLRETPDSKELDNRLASSHTDVEADTVKVIEFQNGSSSEFSVPSPARLNNQNNPSSQPSGRNTEVSNISAHTAALGLETDSVIERYKKLKMAATTGDYLSSEDRGQENIPPYKQNPHTSLKDPFDRSIAELSQSSALDKSASHTPAFSPAKHLANVLDTAREDQSLNSESLYSRLSSASRFSPQSNNASRSKFTLEFDDDENEDLETFHSPAAARRHGGCDGSVVMPGSGRLTSRGTARAKSPLRASGSPGNKGSPRSGRLELSSVPLSPLTGLLHAEPTSQRPVTTDRGLVGGAERHATTPRAYNRLSTDRIHDIFGEDDSILVPPSPELDASA